MVHVTLNDLQTKVKVIHFGTNFLYTTSYRQSIVTFALWCTI